MDLRYLFLLFLLSACTPTLVINKVSSPEIDLSQSGRIILIDSTNPERIKPSQSLQLGKSMVGRLSLAGFANIEKSWEYRFTPSSDWSTAKQLSQLKNLSGADSLIEYRILTFTHFDEGGWGEGSMDETNRGAYLNQTVFYLKRRYILEVAIRAGSLNASLKPFVLRAQRRYSASGQDRQEAAGRLNISSTLFSDMLTNIENNFMEKLNPSSREITRELKETGNSLINEGVTQATYGGLEKAAELWRKALRGKPSKKDELAALHNLAVYYESMDNQKMAARNYRRLFELTGDKAYEKLAGEYQDSQ
ncbi:MAG: DUF6340 family protein [bacterium]